MRKIIERIIIGIFVFVLVYVGWVIFTKFYNASSNRSKNSAVQMVKEIHNAEMNLKPKYGRYVSLEEIIKEKAISTNIANGEYDGYKFSIDLKNERFLIHAIPVNSANGEAFSMDDKGNIQR